MLRTRSWLLLIVVVALVGFVSILAQEGVSYAEPLDTWTIRTSGTTDSLNGIAYGNGTFVVVGYNGTKIQQAVEQV